VCPTDLHLIYDWPGMNPPNPGSGTPSRGDVMCFEVLDLEPSADNGEEDAAGQIHCTLPAAL
jgi:hypothetical protein